MTMACAMKQYAMDGLTEERGRDDNDMRYETPCDGCSEGCSVRGAALQYELLRFFIS